MRGARLGHALPHRGQRLDAGRGQQRAEPQADRQATQVGRVVDAADGETERDVDEDQHPELADEEATLAVDRMVETVRREQDPEQSEDRARGPDRRDIAAEHEARHRPAGRAREIEQEEPDRAVPAFDDRSGQVQRIHVEAEVKQAAVEQRHRPQAPVLPGRDRRLVELERIEQEPAFLREQGRQRDDRAQGDEDHRDRDERAIATTACEVAPRRAGVAHLLGQPAEPVRDLRLVFHRGAAIGLSIGVDGAGQVTVADPGGRHVPPRRIAGRRLSDLDRGLPRRDGRRVVTESIAGLAQPEQCRGRHGGVIEPDDPAEVGGSFGVIAARQGCVARTQQGARLLGAQTTTV